MSQGNLEFMESQTMGSLRASGIASVLGIVILSIMASLLGQETDSSRRGQTLPPALTEPSTPARTNLPKTSGNLRTFQGTGSCSAIACHGGVGRQNCGDQPSSEIWRSEYTVWMTDDPHSRSFSILYDDLATKIATNLAQGGPVVPAYQDLRCLSCHTLPRSEPEFEVTSQLNPDGVGCESCHGPASDWISQHTTSNWRTLDSRTKQRDYQFWDTKNLLQRTQICSGCHVGNRNDSNLADRDMNHDMIAAGHPRLAFEMASYSDLHANHWCEKPARWSENIRTPAPSASERRAWLWATGRLATASAALELSAARAESQAAPWPEFSETNCYSCHQELTPELAALKKPGQRLGRPAWGTWYFSGIEPLVRPNPMEQGGLVELFGNYGKLMQSPVANRPKMALESRQIGQKLRDLADQRNQTGLSPNEIKQILDQQIHNSTDPAPKAWDEEAQRYLTLSSLARSHGKQWMSPQVLRELDMLKIRLQATTATKVR